MTNKDIALYARRFFVGCSADENCGECVLDGKCYSYADKHPQDEFEEFLNVFNHKEEE